MGGRKPLALEELRQMEKPTPVWAETKKKTVENWDGYWCICQRGHIITPGLISMYAEKMEGVFFYAYEPPYLDRSAWKCGICEVPTHWVEWGKLGYEYCPHCGRPLTDAAWEMQERRLAGHENQ